MSLPALLGRNHPAAGSMVSATADAVKGLCAPRVRCDRAGTRPCRPLGDHQPRRSQRRSRRHRRRSVTPRLVSAISIRTGATGWLGLGAVGLRGRREVARRRRSRLRGGPWAAIFIKSNLAAASARRLLLRKTGPGERTGMLRAAFCLWNIEPGREFSLAAIDIAGGRRAGRRGDRCRLSRVRRAYSCAPHVAPPSSRALASSSADG